MLFVLRKIRRKLLADNKVGTYLLYAIGEITLVVVGILIAVSIDGWNDDRKAARQERSYLERLLSENKQDLVTFNTLISDLRQGMQSVTDFSAALKDVTSSDSLVVHMAQRYFQYGSIIPVFTSSKSTFEDLASTGNLEVVKNLRLREHVVRHYAEHLRVKERLEINNQWALSLDAPFMVENDIMQFETNTAHMFPERSLTDMANDLRTRRLKYISNTVVHYWINMDAIDQLEDLQKQTNVLIGKLETELGIQSQEKLPDPLAAGWYGEPVCNVLHENVTIRVLKCTFPPGVGHERHYHSPHVGYTLAGSLMRITDTTGTREVQTVQGSSFSSKGIEWHEVLNVGDKTAEYLIIEYK